MSKWAVMNAFVSTLVMQIIHTTAYVCVVSVTSPRLSDNVPTLSQLFVYQVSLHTKRWECRDTFARYVKAGGNCRYQKLRKKYYNGGHLWALKYFCWEYLFFEIHVGESNVISIVQHMNDIVNNLKLVSSFIPIYEKKTKRWVEKPPLSLISIFGKQKWMPCNGTSTSEMSRCLAKSIK
ncbi:hypothetical protein J6590_061629 [Homalodisca vitripennis]|nr:hypothetical protein J6590_061629 [Homalodisca vitripennis]